jgi:predicted extracellular nuclease
MINGATDTEYRSFALPDVTLNPGAYFVVCGDAANVANCDLDVSPDSNLIQNGAPEAVALVDGTEILDTVSYEGAVPGYTEGSGGAPTDPGATGDDDLGISRLPNGTDTDHNDIDFGLACITPGAANVDTTDCAPPELVTIPWIQGSGAASDHEGETVTTSGVVTADLQGDAHLNGFFMQDPAGDGDPATSDGIFVYDFYDIPDTDVTVGDLVEVTGTVSEYNGFTELSFVTVTITGSGSVTPTAVDLPVGAVTDLERYEGMLLAFPEELTVSEVYDLGRYGEFVVSAGGRQFQPTNVAAPSIPFDTNGNSVADSLEPGRLIVDDGSTEQNPDPVPFLPGQGPNDTLRVGQTTTGLTGVLNYAFGDYSLIPTVAPTFAGNPRPDTAPDVGGDITVATYNTLNYWTTFDDGSNDARGADSAAEFTRQQDKTVAAILAMGADVIGLEELENNGPVAIGNLVDALNAVAGAGTWAAVPDPAYPGGLESTNAIKVGIIYRTDAVTPVGAPVADDDPIFAEDRPPVAQTFQAGDEVFTVVVNHFKSKGSTGATGADLDQNDGQGAYNDRRTQQALALIDFVAALQTLSGDPDVLAVGDFNSYAMEDPIETLRGALTDLADVYIPADGQYSYLYYGMSGLLDHAFASDSLATKVSGAALWHINADEPTLFDYNTEYNPPGLYAPNPYRSSDHDPLLVGIDLSEIVPIPEIQGSGQFSPYDGQVVTTTGVVTAVSADGRDMWIQDPAGDGDPATSDGIMVDDRNTLPVAPVVGDLVQVTATVQELQFGNALPLTQLNNPVGPSFQILSSDNELPDPVKLTNLPNVSMADGIAFWEPLEGMLVSVRRATVVAPTSPYGEFAMLTRWDARGHSGFVSRVSQIFLRALWGGNVDYNPERIVVDDATLDSAIEVRPGDTVRSLTGVVDYTFGMYKLQPTAYDIHAAPLPTGPVSRRSGSRGDATITTFNVENLFDLVDNPEKDDASSTPTAAELETKLTKLAMAVEDELELPAVLIVQEVENTAILQEVGDRVNAAAGTSYVATSFETSDARGIEVGFLWDADRVDLLDAYQLSGPDVEAAFGPSSPSPGREPIVGVFEISGREITIVGNHFKSKSGDDPLYGVNWPPERITEEQRKAQAHVVRDFVNTLFAADRHALVMVAGDLNDFSFAEPGEGSDHPVAILEGSRREVRLTDLVDRESSRDRYTYIYDGNSQVLDHMLVSPELRDLLAGTDILHFNAAYPASVASDASTAIRSSDHDPIEGRFTLRRFHFPWWWWF